MTIVLTQTAKVFNDKGTKLVIDGGNKVTLSGGGTIRILYMATCDKAQVYPPGPGDCNTNPGVQLVVQNITFVDGNAKGIPDGTNNGGGGGAIHAQGGSLKVVNARFFNNVCDDLGSDLGGGAIRKLDYLVAPGAGPARPVWIVNSTFGGKAGLRQLVRERRRAQQHRRLVEHPQLAASPRTPRSATARTAARAATAARSTTTATRSSSNVTSSLIENNKANEGGSAIFFVSNNKTRLDHDHGLDHAQQPARHLRDARPARLLRDREGAGARSSTRRSCADGVACRRCWMQPSTSDQKKSPRSGAACGGGRTRSNSARASGRTFAASARAASSSFCQRSTSSSI